MRKSFLRLLALSLLSGSALIITSCSTTTSKQQFTDDQTRFKQQQLGYPDKESLEQEKAETERARKEDMLKK